MNGYREQCRKRNGHLGCDRRWRSSQKETNGFNRRERNVIGGVSAGRGIDLAVFHPYGCLIDAIVLRYPDTYVKIAQNSGTYCHR